MTAFRFWTVTDLATVRELSGVKTLAQVAAELGRTRDAVRKQARRHGISFMKRGEAHPNAKYRDADIALAWRLKAQNWSVRAIAERTDIRESYLEGMFYRRVGFREHQAPAGPTPRKVKKTAQVRAL